MPLSWTRVDRWEPLFLGAHTDAVELAEHFGITKDRHDLPTMILRGCHLGKLVSDIQIPLCDAEAEWLEETNDKDEEGDE